MINVTKTFFPPLDEYSKNLKRVWENQWLTNRGTLTIELEKNISSHLSLEETRLIAMNNGTIPIQIALKLLGKGGEVVTTPFSYVATSASIVWENCTPVYVDIHPEYFTIDESKIESVITERTTCILATHVFGNPCNIEEIERIAQKHKLSVVYDAAHCFDVKYKNKSIFEYGDISTCSFHATKLFHTGEGGALFTNNEDLFHRSYYSHNFGHNGPLDFHGLGINGKISELQSAMGLTVLPYLKQIIKARKDIISMYLNGINFSKLKTIRLREHTDWNYSYFPIVFNSEENLLQVQLALNEKKIFPRRYFYPSLNALPYVKHDTVPISENISKTILCLPLYHDLDFSDVATIIDIVNGNS